jgi:hypothetical protein
MNKEEKIKARKAMMKRKGGRHALFKRSMLFFGCYYFKMFFTIARATFHKDWVKSMQSGKNTYIKAFRGSAKTVWFIIYIVWCIAYKKKRYIMYYCYNKGQAESNLFAIIVQLQTNAKFVRDFGYLYPDDVKVKEAGKQKKTIGEFITTNGVKVEAMSIGQSPRGKNFITKDGAHRPDLVGLDDIDVTKSVQNPVIIEKNYNWLKSELMGGLSDEEGKEAQIVALGNTINEDGLCPRMESDYTNDPDWNIFIQPVLNKLGEIIWRYTKKTLAKIRKKQGEIAFGQNMLLIPYRTGQKIFRREWFNWKDKTDGFFKIVMGVDPSTSEKGGADPLGIVVTGWYKDKSTKEVRTHALESMGLKGKDKDPSRLIPIIKNLYGKWDVNHIVVEGVAFQAFLGKILRQEKLACKEGLPGGKNKQTRALEQQADVEF